ncbi:maleylacetoacetate isomerase [Thioclava sp. BHET1]|nr:maleylacetoacetate isomerase [Thioclava sp. BHET1]
MIRLYDYWRSSASYRVRIALGLAGLTWESVPIDLVAGAQSSPEHLARNPQGLVPALEIDGHLLTQSLAILEYLDTTRGLGLQPLDPLARARARAMADAIAMDIHPVCNLRVAKFATAQSQDTLSMKDWMQHFIAPGLAALETMVEGEAYCFGTRLSLADLCLVPQIYNARRWEIELGAMPKLTRIAAHLETLPAFAAAHPELAPH